MSEDVRTIYFYMLSRRLSASQSKNKLAYAREYMRMFMIRSTKMLRSIK